MRCFWNLKVCLKYVGSVLQVQNEKVYIGIMCKLAESLHSNSFGVNVC